MKCPSCGCTLDLEVKEHLEEAEKDEAEEGEVEASTPPRPRKRGRHAKGMPEFKKEDE